MIVWLITLSLLAAFLYRRGGVGGGKWYNDTKMRDIGVPALAIIIIIFILHIKAIWWAHLLSFLMMFGSMTTYCKFGDQEDVHWYNWMCTGLFYGFTVIPYMLWGDVSVIAMLSRMAFLGAFITIWSEANSLDWLEEGGRGFLFIVSLPLLLI